MSDAVAQSHNRHLRLNPALAATLLAYGAFGLTFRGPRSRFWQRMTGTALTLGGLSLAADPELRRLRWRGRDLVLGSGLAAGLYLVFAAGDRGARRVLPGGADDIQAIYALRQLRSRPELALRLALLIAPAEELFWRGLLQRSLVRRLGRPRGAALASALYGGAHLCTGNLTLIGAAAVAGGAWSGVAELGMPMPALITSHVLWDVWIFLVRPTHA
ncbi:MAG: CPBP family glutamic-type intramembrane protease [Candidatus Dormibacteria bacterium]